MQLSFFDTLKAEVQASPTGIVPRDYQQSAIDARRGMARHGTETQANTTPLDTENQIG